MFGGIIIRHIFPLTSFAASSAAAISFNFSRCFSLKCFPLFVVSPSFIFMRHLVIGCPASLQSIQMK